MKVMTILGTRPEIIRLSRVIPLLDRLCQHVVIHTGQNYDRTLNQVFFEELALRQPDEVLACKAATLFGQVANILQECERVLMRERPDRVLILGDTNSALSSIVAKRLGIPIFHMEAGNRCYDDRVPEEVNRRIVDHCSDVWLPYTERSRANLLREGIPSHRIYVTGNPIYEVLAHYASQIDASDVHDRIGVRPGAYFLVTLHRAENVDVAERLDQFLEGLRAVREAHDLPIICSLHPRTRSQLEKRSRKLDEYGIIAVEPLGLFDFVKLEKHARCIFTDSGTVQEEACIFRVPNVTLRDVTERPETIEVGSNILAGADPAQILRATQAVLDQENRWVPPPEYTAENVSGTVVRIVLGHLEGSGRA